MTTETQDRMLASLGAPRFSAPERDVAQPFVLRGSLDGADFEFYASPTDTHDYGRDLHARVLLGDFGPIGDYEPPPVFVPPWGS